MDLCTLEGQRGSGSGSHSIEHLQVAEYMYSHYNLIVIPISQLMKLRPRDIQSFSQGHTHR